jgi:flagellar basal-body rod modification protein FlgD
VLNGASLVGREVLCSASETTLAVSGESVKGQFEVPEGTSNVSIVIKDAQGQAVRTITPAFQTGLNEFTWDGLTAEGDAAPAGTYEIEVVAGIGGQNYSLETLLTTRVSSVSIDASGTNLTLNTGIGAVALANVRRVM